MTVLSSLALFLDLLLMLLLNKGEHELLTSVYIRAHVRLSRTTPLYQKLSNSGSKFVELQHQKRINEFYLSQIPEYGCEVQLMLDFLVE